MKKNKIIIGVILLFVLLNITSCAPKGVSATEYGFFSGIIHGIVFVFALIGKLFGFNIGLYAEHNTGFFYWLGFILGIGGLGGGARSSR
jgi:hypothetical protein